MVLGSKQRLRRKNISARAGVASGVAFCGAICGGGGGRTLVSPFQLNSEHLRVLRGMSRVVTGTQLLKLS